ncbi:cell division protein FtsL [Thalassococcus lentus]|uniref:Cell division protein FtsL n=1 Tax=Thalassococcus lentus TaxID=1210524 RepID=A0ABT4XTN4_9RHOB|nr:cell division protein FtsL [Thalassococcus lentus]MDA7425333.1 cell division protein FtsL [Thalassococcus lentus]
MRTLLFLLAAMAVIGSGFWAYHENYKTQAELDHADDLRRDITQARERLAILRAEWAYLNRPDRLRDLADLNFERLGLLPLRPDQFGMVDQVIFPEPPKLDITMPIEVTSAGADQAGADR